MSYPPQGVGAAKVIEEVNYPEVGTYADLPDAAESTDEIFLVLEPTGTLGIDRKRAGLWRSNGTAWYRLGTLEGSGTVVFGTAPTGKHQVYRIWRNAQGNLEYEYEDVPES